MPLEEKGEKGRLKSLCPEAFNSSGHDATKYRAGITALLDSMLLDRPPDEVWPVIVAAGKGARARATGLDVPKPLASVLGTPAILHVLRNVGTAFGTTRPPIVILSPETEEKVRNALAGEDLTFVVQPEARGTGDAALCAEGLMRDFRGRALIIWGTQAAVRPGTIRRTLKLAALFNDYEMVLPTALNEIPYAPLLRDEAGRVRAALETHLERASRPQFGESNIGVFLLNSEAMFGALFDLRRRHWDEAGRRYDRAGGELGFPNELINYFAQRLTGVLACPLADPREGQGIKEFDDIARCEQFISEFQCEGF